MTSHKTTSPEELVTLSLSLVRQATALAAGLAAAGGLNPADLTALRALDVIAANGEVTPGGLRDELGLSSAATTGLLDRLERAGLAVRSADPDDRRRVLVTLTERARTFGGTFLAPYQAAAIRAAHAVPVNHRGSVRDYLAAITQAAAPHDSNADHFASSPTPGS